jgi:hypothetical protein
MSHFLFITKINLIKTLKKYPNITREMRYIAGERKIRHEENISTVRKKFAETKRQIIRELIEGNSNKGQHIASRKIDDEDTANPGNKFAANDDFLLQLR